MAEAARIISEAVDPEANIISGMVIEEGMEDEMKVTVIATGFDRVTDRQISTGGERASASTLRQRVHSRIHKEPVRETAPSQAPTPVVEKSSAPPMTPAPEAMAVQDTYATPVPASEPPPPMPPEGEDGEVPFYRKVLAQKQGHGEDPHGYGPNWSNVDDYDIPTVLRKQMD